VDIIMKCLCETYADDIRQLLQSFLLTH
jgi:hypothetical protein